MLTMSTFSLLHEKNNFALQFFVIISYYRFTYEIHKRLYVHPRAMHIIYTAWIFSTIGFTIGKYVYRHGKYRPDTDTDYRSITTKTLFWIRASIEGKDKYYFDSFEMLIFLYIFNHCNLPSAGLLGGGCLESAMYCNWLACLPAFLARSVSGSSAIAV